MSTYLYNILSEVPIVDKVKLVIMPDVSSVDLNALFKMLFNEESKTVSVKDMRRIKSIATLFKLEPMLVMTRKPGRPKGMLYFMDRFIVDLEYWHDYSGTQKSKNTYYIRM